MEIKKNTKHVIRNMILIALWAFFTYTLGNLCYSIYSVINATKNDSFELLTVYLLTFGHAFEIIHFYFFDKIFRKTLKQYYRKLIYIKLTM